MIYRDLIIIGYPKSGTTWVTRLVAELVSCPVAGFWKSDHAEIAEEGADRLSENRCYKGHHSYTDLIEKGGIENAAVIYVVRDPRDIIISGSYYFASSIKLSTSLFDRKFFRDAAKRLIRPRHYRIQRMLEALLDQDTSINYWLKTPWREHVNAYLENGAFYVRYEDLLSEPLAECNRILEFIGINRNEAEVRDAIGKQSFAEKKKNFILKEDLRNARFLRVGRKEQWRQVMSANDITKMKETLGFELNKLGYALD